MGNPAVARLKIGLYRLYAVEKYPIPTGVIIRFKGILNSAPITFTIAMAISRIKAPCRKLCLVERPIRFSIDKPYHPIHLFCGYTAAFPKHHPILYIYGIPVKIRPPTQPDKPRNTKRGANPSFSKIPILIRRACCRTYCNSRLLRDFQLHIFYR